MSKGPKTEKRGRIVVQEKRKDKRVKEDFSILCRIFRKIQTDVSVSRIMDISKSGISFLTDNQMTKNDILQMIFRIPPDFKEKVELFGRVIESEPEQESVFKTRVAFIDINPQAKNTLNRIIEQATSRKN